MKFGVVLKPYGKPLNNQNSNDVRRIKNRCPSMATITPISRQHPPPQRNEALVFTCFNYGKMVHMAQRRKSMPKPDVGYNASVNQNYEQFIAMINNINMAGGCDG